MSDQFYHIKIKKEFASAILEELQQMNAIEIAEEPIPVWQQNETAKRLKALKENKKQPLSKEDFFKIIESEDD